MSSYVVTGANRGLGLAFLKELSKNPDNTVVGLVRNKELADERMKKEDISNVTIIQAGITDGPALKEAAVQVSKLTGGKLDYLINNAAYNSEVTGEKTIDDFRDNAAELEEDISVSIDVNVIGTIKTTNAFLPLIIASNGAKKVISLTTGLGDVPFTNEISLPIAVGYSISKAALNMAVAKFQAAYAEKGILFIAISPGLVATAEAPKAPSKEVAEMVQKFFVYEPDWKGAITPQESVELVLKVINQKSLENGDGGKAFSHWGNDRWL